MAELKADIIERRLSQIASICRDFGVCRLELFGSAADGRFRDEASDLDFFVEFSDSGWKGSFRRFMGLKLALEDLFDRPVDLVEPKVVRNPYFAAVAFRHRKLVYAA